MLPVIPYGMPPHVPGGLQMRVNYKALPGVCLGDLDRWAGGRGGGWELRWRTGLSVTAVCFQESGVRMSIDEG